MTNYKWLLENREELVKDILAQHLGKEKGIPNCCSKTRCDNCDFNRFSGLCTDAAKKWLEEEHEPLYKKGDKDYCDGDFIKVSRYADYAVVLEEPISSIKKKVGHIESEVDK